MRSLREQGLGTSALAIVGTVKGFVSSGSLEEENRESAAYSGGADDTRCPVNAVPSTREVRRHAPAVMVSQGKS